MTPKEKLRKLVLARIAKVPGCSSKLLFSKSIKSATKLTDLEIESVLGAMRKEGVIHCTNGLWWKR